MSIALGFALVLYGQTYAASSFYIEVSKRLGDTVQRFSANKKIPTVRRISHHVTPNLTARTFRAVDWKRRTTDNATATREAIPPTESYQRCYQIKIRWSKWCVSVPKDDDTSKEIKLI